MGVGHTDNKSAQHSDSEKLSQMFLVLRRLQRHLDGHPNQLEQRTPQRWPTAPSDLFTSIDGQRLSLGVIEAVIGGEGGEHVHAEEEDEEVDAHRDQAHPQGGGEPTHAVLRQ